MNASRMKRQLLAACAALSLVGTGSAAVPMPEGYTALDWIESQGSQWIDTKFTGTANTKVTMDFTYVQKLNSHDQVFGSYSGSGDWLSYSVFFQGGNVSYSLNPKANLWKQTKPATVGSRYLAELDAPGKSFTLSSVDASGTPTQIHRETVTADLTGCKTTGTILLSTARKEGTAPDMRAAFLRIHSATITEGGVPVRVFVPCRDDKGEAGLWDAVNGKFYGNDTAGGATGRFRGSAPAPMPAGYTALDWIESSGLQWIDTEFTGTANTKVAMDFTYLKRPNDGAVHDMFFGSFRAKTSGQLSFLLHNNSSKVSYSLQNGGDAWHPTVDLQVGSRYLAELDALNGSFTVSSVDAAGTPTQLVKETVTKPTNCQTSGTILLCNARDAGSATADRAACLRIHSATITEGGVPVRSFVPCRNPDGEAGLWDTVEGVFYGNDTAGGASGRFKGKGSAPAPMPDGYTALDWIESTGGQWIDTGVLGNEKTKLEMDCTYVRAINGTSGKDEFFGSQVDNYGSKALSFSVYRNGSGFIASALSYDVKGDWLMQGNYTPQAGVRYQVILDAPSRTFSFISGGQTVNTTTHPAFTPGSTVGSILLCSVRNNGNPMKERCSYLRIYSATITEGGEAVRTFVPCQSDKGEAGLWDSVEGEFYGNASGVGRFFGSNDVSGGVRSGYIESHGAQYIDTGVKGTAKTKVEMDCTYLQPVAYSEFFGSQVSGHNPAALSFSVYNNGSGNIASALNTAATGDWKSNNKYKPVPGTRYLAVLDAPNKLFTFSTVAADGTTTEVDRLVRDTAPTGETLDSILLCCERQNGNLLSARCSYLRIHSVRIYSGSTLAHEFVPGLSVDGRVGLIDTKDGDRFFGNASGTGDFTAGGLIYTMDGTTMKAYNGPLSTKALEGHSTVELADGSFTLEDDCAVNGTLKLTGGAKITFGLTADENDSLSATSVDLSKASAAKPVEILLDMSSAPDTSTGYVLVSGGLAVGDEAKFHVADGNAVLAVENGALVLTFPNYDLKVSDVSVRQFWPWNTKVTVDMTVSGVVQGKAHPLALDAYTEDTLLGTIPAEALSPAPVVDRNGKWSFTFDPTKVGFLRDRGAVPGFKIVPSASADNVLYVDIDLTKAAGEPGQVTYITEEDITSGKYGEWKRQYWDAGADEIAWTGVTADDKYKTTHLVMRRIPAGTFKMGSPITENTRGYDGGTQDRLQTEVTLTKPYYIGVFEVTQSQWEKMNSGSAVAGDITPACGISYDDIRGDGKTMNGPYDWPRTTAVDPNSLIGKFRVQTGIPFDLPTEAQWEKAARAGTDGAYYDGTVQPDEEKLDKLAWYNNNNPDTHKKVQNVGLKKPNNYGLYDMLGNAMEYVLDCYIAGSVEETVDPVGPLANKDKIPRIRKGGQCNWAYDRARSAFRRVDWHAATFQAGQGFRLAMPAQW